MYMYQAQMLGDIGMYYSENSCLMLRLCFCNHRRRRHRHRHHHHHHRHHHPMV